MLDHADVRTTQIDAHLSPEAVQGTVVRAQAAFALAKVIPIGCHAVVTPGTATSTKSRKSKWRATEDSNL